MILQSAGTASPASRTTMSPVTRSSEWTVIWWPSRMALLVAALICCSASMAFSALLSWSTPRMAFKRTTTRMMMASVNSTSPAARLVMTERTAAIIRMISIGSFSSSKNFLSMESFLASASLFLPFFSRRDEASAELRPSWPVFWLRSTSSAVERYSFILEKFLHLFVCWTSYSILRSLKSAGRGICKSVISLQKDDNEDSVTILHLS